MKEVFSGWFVDGDGTVMKEEDDNDDGDDESSIPFLLSWFLWVDSDYVLRIYEMY